jgi:hypothetical protein
VRVFRAVTRAEAEMVRAFLAGQGIPALISYSRGLEVVGLLAEGPRDVCVRADQLERARELVDSHFGEEDPEP